MKKIIEVVSYDPNWPHIFEKEAALIRQALGDNCIAIHHIGSTAVPGLAAKPKIDILLLVKDPVLALPSLEASGYEYRGEWNVPFKYGMRKRVGTDINLHMCQAGHMDIEPALLFRDFLRKNDDFRNEYANLKKMLALKESSAEKITNAVFSEYTLGKDDFIKKILHEAGFTGTRFGHAAHHSEWAAAKYFRDNYFFRPHGIEDPYTWTFNHEEHAHLVLYQACEIIGYAHIQFWLGSRAAIRIIAIDEDKRNQNSGSVFLALIEKWLKSLGVKSIHAESRQSSLRFYLKNGYSSMPFDDPENHESDPNDVPVGKLL